MRKSLALVWLFVVCILLTYNTYLIIHKKISFNTNILALLPTEQQNPLIETATDHMFNAVTQQLAILIGARHWNDAAKSADAYLNIIQTRPDLLTSQSIQATHFDLFQKSRLGLLTHQQEAALQTETPSYWTNVALSSLYSPVSGFKIGTWQDDPFNLFSGWLQTRAQETPVRPRDGKLFVAGDTHNYVVLLLQLTKPAFSMSTQKAVIPLLNQAADAAKKADAHINIISTGVVLHAAAASTQAHHEMSTIALGSIIGIIILMLLVFRSLKPLLLIGLSIAIGLLGAFSICELLLGQIHLLTLVFGASLLGIAQDYGIYYLCSHSTKNIWPGLVLTLTAALLGYAGLALTPFPGLQQMALFSGLGLLFAWLTVICWFPILIHSTTITITPLAKKFEATLYRWPRFAFNKKSIFTACLLLVIIMAGLFKLTTSDDIRSLQNPSQTLIHDQLKLSRLLDVPSLMQFYVVRGQSEQAVLEHEEALKLKLQPLITQHIISGVDAISNWVPSLKRQQDNQVLIKTNLLFKHGPLDQVATKIGENPQWSEQTKKHLLRATQVLTPEIFFNNPISQPWRYLWLGKIEHQYVSIVTFRGLANYGDLPLLKNSANNLTGVQWVDKISAISSILGHYREYMGYVLFGAYAAIYGLLFCRYRFTAWRILISPALATFLTLALFGIFGVPLELFHVLAFMLMLGLGVDYGIFLQEKSAWLAVGLSAVSALLSFGLLALSKTPPLHAFGLTMLIGMALVWLISPCFRISASLHNEHD